jgi:hypothetical protein
MGRLTVAGLLISVLEGCSLVYGGDLDAKQCTKQEDCNSAASTLGYPLVCEANACRQLSCASQVDCPTNTQCVNAVCVSPDAGTPSAACSQDSECPGSQLCGFDKFCYDKWGCLDQDRDWTANTTAHYRAAVRDFVESTNPDALGMISAKACSLNNIACVPPFVSSDVVIYDQTMKTIDVPFGSLPMDGFTGTINVVEVDAGVPSDGGLPATYPGLIHFTSQNPLVSDLTPQTDILLSTPATVAQLSLLWKDSIPYPVDEAKGLLVLQVHDCGGRKAAGMKLTPRATAETAEYLFVPIESKTTPNPELTKTTEDGAALLFNLPGSNVSFTLTDEDANRVINDRIAIALKAPAINYFAYYPRRSAVERWMGYARSQGLTP